MSLRSDDTAPNFVAQTTEGEIDFHDWIGDSYAVLFSHPKDFTPVCTTELDYMAGLKGEFDMRNTKIVGLSVDPVENHQTVSAGGSTAGMSEHGNVPVIESVPQSYSGNRVLCRAGLPG